MFSHFRLIMFFISMIFRMHRILSNCLVDCIRWFSVWWLSPCESGSIALSIFYFLCAPDIEMGRTYTSRLTDVMEIFFFFLMPSHVVYHYNNVRKPLCVYIIEITQRRDSEWLSLVSVNTGNGWLPAWVGHRISCFYQFKLVTNILLSLKACS